MSPIERDPNGPAYTWRGGTWGFPNDSAKRPKEVDVTSSNWGCWLLAALVAAPPILFLIAVLLSSR